MCAHPVLLRVTYCSVESNILQRVIPVSILQALCKILIQANKAWCELYQSTKGASIYDVQRERGREGVSRKTQNLLTKKGGGGQKIPKLSGRYIWKPPKAECYKSDFSREAFSPPSNLHSIIAHYVNALSKHSFQVSYHGERLF